MSEGLKEYWRAEMEELGEIRLRTRERVDRSFLRKRCGTITGIEGHEIGTFAPDRMRAASSRKGAYDAVDFMMICVCCGRGLGGSVPL